MGFRGFRIGSYNTGLSSRDRIWDGLTVCIGLVVSAPSLFSALRTTACRDDDEPLKDDR